MSDQSEKDPIFGSTLEVGSLFTDGTLVLGFTLLGAVVGCPPAGAVVGAVLAGVNEYLRTHK